MCRLIAYLGTPMVLDQLVFQPKNSLINQSYEAKELEEPLNGDGFGVGWYVPELDPGPAVFVSTSPAWSNRNLRMMAPRILSPCVFAHVRAASVGDTSEANCHPFSFDKWLFMHNGTVGGFSKLKRTIRRDLPDDIYNWLRGQTDSEHFFAMFLTRRRKIAGDGPAAIVEALRQTIKDLEALRQQIGCDETTWLNVVVTDGVSVVGVRWTSDPAEEPLSLYWSEGSRYVCEQGVCRMEKAKPGEASVLIVSEKLTDIRNDWRKVPANSFVVVSPDRSVRVEAVQPS
jgi:glutamine amidotransferase